MNETLVRVLCEEVDRLNFSCDYWKKEAEKRAKELDELRKKLDELTF